MRQKLTFSILLTLFSFLQSMAQQRTITGKVTDSTGNGLSDASVVVVGQRTGVRTDAQGDFSISVPSTAKELRISYVGSAAQTVDISSTSNVTVTLASATSSLAEVIVSIGYGTARKKDLTGSVSSIKAKDLTRGLSLRLTVIQAKNLVWNHQNIGSGCVNYKSRQNLSFHIALLY